MAVSSSSSFASIRTIERPKNANGKQSCIADYFGCNVFDLRTMAERLSSQDLKTMTTVMKFGGKIEASLADRIASAAKEWALEKGVSHYCHWFQPQTGTTAEKHDAFLWFDKQGHPIERFTGPELLQSEPDASSFPSGGMRSTFEARGYTGWDPSSPMFIMETENGKTLYIPSVFISYHGEVLDFKTPLLRSNESLSAAATKTLHFLGETKVERVTTSVGPEQEFFVVDKSFAMNRLDLRMTGRTVFGRKPPKGQELEEHYFGNIPARVQAFINELEIELYKLGVPLKTRHNEVAPGQFEVAPIFEHSNIASDHNQLVMKCLKGVALKHNLVVLLHEKPFEGVNGSGKHVNWSLCDSLGRNLLDPGVTPHENLVFLTFLCGVLQGIYSHADAIRASIAFAGNDHRLGANEAPPAIISVFLGNTLDKILTALEAGTDRRVSAEKMMIDLGVSHLHSVAKDNTDRNRTSPFAFTGNKFEFRAVGSSASISYPTSILNAAVHDGLNILNEKLAAKAQNGVVSNDDLLIILKDIVAATKKIRFEGNGYSIQWREEAAKRGLSNFPTTPLALEVLSNKTQTQFLVDAKVFNEADIASRQAIQQERYIKQRFIEVNCALEMAQTYVLPACYNYLNELLKTAKHAVDLGISTSAKKLAEGFSEQVNHIYTAHSTLQLHYGRLSDEGSADHHNLSKLCLAISEELMPKLEELRTAVDLAEGIVPHHLWPYPKYTDLMYGIEV